MSLNASARYHDRFPGSAERSLEHSFGLHPQISPRDRGFALHLVQGVLRWRLRLDWIIKQHTRFPFRKIQAPVLNILRLAVYQIFFMDRVPESAAVNEATTQARAVAPGYVAGSVNGILRAVCRNKDRITFPDREGSPVEFLSVYYSYPRWLVEKWIREMGIKETESLLEASNRIPTLVVRMNNLKTDRQSLISNLSLEGVKGRGTSYSPEGVELEHLSREVNQLKGFKEGLFQVQGEGAQICSRLLSPRPRSMILDICSGFGGKATHLAQLCGDQARVIALDRNCGRLVSLKKSCRRLGIRCVLPVAGDAFVALPFKRDFDYILIDAPCSGLGTISRHPDTKWSKSEEDIKRLSVLQGSILERAAPLLKKGGEMVYATCTISREENEEVVRKFLEAHPEMALVGLKDRLPGWGVDLIDDQGFFRTLPHHHGMEGFFGALMVKK